MIDLREKESIVKLPSDMLVIGESFHSAIENTLIARIRVSEKK